MKLPPDCAVCGAKPGADHAKDCNVLRAMKAQAYPGLLDDNGMPWWMNALSKRDRRIDELEAQIADLRRAADTEAAVE